MAYKKTNWENGKTPINSDNLNKIEEGIANAVEKDSEARVSNVVSRNLFYEKKPKLGYYDNSGSWISADAITTYGPFYVKGTIYISANVLGDANCRLTEFKADGTFIKRTIIMNSALILDSNTEYIMVSNDTNTNEGKYYTNFMVTSGDKATPYVPYLNLEEAMNKSNMLVIEKITLDEMTISSGGRGNVYKNVAKEGLTPLGIVGVDGTNDYVSIGKFLINNGTNNAFLTITNNNVNNQTTTITITVLYVKNN